MGLISFIKDAGEKLFGGSSAVAATTPAAAAPSAEELNAKAGAAIRTYIETQKLGLTNLAVTYDGSSGKVTLTGGAPTQEASEKASLAAGNVSSVTQVDNQLTVAAAANASQYHDVVSGDTLSAIAKKYYGDANKYMKIFEANKPMLSDPNKIYPGQKLRIPAL
ncbi:peptidoglycan-binding protein LysM [Xylophilus sp. ASV27]|uniref:peptidoglycan-binding protein LysM n=1 Tax=Xylophilus sp. ASV27 TaxID=2795129 RepID=UPI0018EB6C3F|nr:peptidoglycan-binding protein LysM [Xylophilus sp. ASV27]